MEGPTLILFCGLPGSGKTTLARELVTKYKAIRLNTDEWVADLGLDPTDEQMHTKMQNRLWELAKELLGLGHSVILEDGLWTRKERDVKRQAASKLGVLTELHYLNVPLDELIRRLKIRNMSGTHGVAKIDIGMIESYAKLFEPLSEKEQALFDRVIVY